MASVPILSDGKNTAVYLDNSQINQSAGQLRSDILGAEKLKLNKALQEEQDFLKAIQTDPVGLMTQAGIKQQADVLKQFNERWTDEMRKNNGILSTDQKIQMAQDKVAVQSFQQNLAANQQRALQELKLYQTNPAKYDEKMFTENYMRFLDTGEYASGLKKRPELFTDALRKRIIDFRKSQNTDANVTPDKSGMNKITKTKGTIDIARNDFLDFALNGEDSDAHLVYLAGEFDKLPAATKRQYLDTDGDGKVTREEVEAARNYGGAADLTNNPIVKWAADTYAPQFIGVDEDFRNKPSSFGMSSTLNWGGKTVNYTPPVMRNYDIGGGWRTSEWFDTIIPVDSPVNLPASSKYLDDDDWYSLEEEGKKRNINGQVIGYDKQRDMVFLRQTTGEGSMDNAQVIAAPRADLPKDFTKGIEVMFNGQRVSINDLPRADVATAQKPKAY